MDEKIKDIVIALIEKDHFNIADEVDQAKAIAKFITTLEEELSQDSEEAYVL